MTDLTKNRRQSVGRPLNFSPGTAGHARSARRKLSPSKPRGGEERTGLAKDFQWVWKDNTWISNYPFPPHMRKARQLNVVGFTPVGGCQKLTAAACQSAQPEGKVELTVVELTMAGKIAAGLVVGFAFYGLACLLRGA